MGEFFPIVPINFWVHFAYILNEGYPCEPPVIKLYSRDLPK